MGEEQFRWFIGTVEDVNDPQQLGRVRVRIINEHDDPSIQTNELLWATPIQDITSAGHNGVGKSPTGILVGSQVFGFFLDGQEKQLPMIWGTYAKLPDGTQATNDVPGLARGINTLNITTFGNEPASAYAAKYPYNNVTVTQSGHVVELDDTPSAERIRIYHKSGTYTEVNSQGQSVSKIVGNGYEVVVQDKTVYVGGDCTIVVQGSCNITAQGDAVIEAQGSCSLTAPGGVNVTGGSNIGTDGSIQAGLGDTGTFTSVDGSTIQVDNGIITNIY